MRVGLLFNVCVLCLCGGAPGGVGVLKAEVQALSTSHACHTAVHACTHYEWDQTRLLIAARMRAWGQRYNLYHVSMCCMRARRSRVWCTREDTSVHTPRHVVGQMRMRGVRIICICAFNRCHCCGYACLQARAMDVARFVKMYTRRVAWHAEQWQREQSILQQRQQQQQQGEQDPEPQQDQQGQGQQAGRQQEEQQQQERQEQELRDRPQQQQQQQGQALQVGPQQRQRNEQGRLQEVQREAQQGEPQQQQQQHAAESQQRQQQQQLRQQQHRRWLQQRQGSQGSTPSAGGSPAARAGSSSGSSTPGLQGATGRPTRGDPSASQGAGPSGAGPSRSHPEAAPQPACAAAGPSGAQPKATLAHAAPHAVQQLQQQQQAADAGAAPPAKRVRSAAAPVLARVGSVSGAAGGPSSAQPAPGAGAATAREHAVPKRPRAFTPLTLSLRGVSSGGEALSVQGLVTAFARTRFGPAVVLRESVDGAAAQEGA